MGFFSAWPMLAVLIAIFALAATPLFRAADSPPIPSSNRVVTLDGLRGFLALAVFFHHGALYHGYIQNGVWTPPTDRLFGLLGSFGVSIFFMITGFLFWSQLMAKQGRPDWIRLYLGRLFRIGPLYLFAAASMVVGVFLITGPTLRESPARLVGALVRWAALGLWSGVPINGVERPGILLADVTWSLRLEWFFYASLAVTAIFTRIRHGAWGLPLAGLAISMALLVYRDIVGGDGNTAAFLALFSVGMLVAALKGRVKSIDFRSPLASLAAAALLLCVLLFFHTAYGAAPITLVGAAFFLIANGATLFGLLETRAAKRLGDISFGIYLLQGLVLAAVFSFTPVRDLALRAPLQHWCVVALAGALLIMIATGTHVFIERPGVDLGRRVADLFRRRASSTPAPAE